MLDREISLSPRKEDIRDKNEVTSLAVQFELEQIKEHFYNSLDNIKKQFTVADNLLCADKEDEAMDVWRSQIVFIEGILDFLCTKSANTLLFECLKANGKNLTAMLIL